MKAREIHMRLKNKVDPEVLTVLEALGESLSVQTQEIKTLAELLDNLTDILMKLGVAIEGTQGAVDKINKIRQIPEV